MHREKSIQPTFFGGPSEDAAFRSRLEARARQREERDRCIDIIVTTIEYYFSDHQLAFQSGRELKYSLQLLLADLRAIQEKATPQISPAIQVDFTAILEGKTQQYEIIFSIIAEADKIYLRQRQDQPNAVQDEIFSDLGTW